jgi:thiol:disulfide interchange protein
MGFVCPYLSVADTLNWPDATAELAPTLDNLVEPVLVFVYTDWCSQCGPFKRTVLNSNVVRDELVHWKSFQMDAEAATAEP